jgi:OOP family OmpA-OmpF porin
MKKMMTALAIAAASLTAQAEGFYVGGGVGFNAIKNELATLNTTMVSAVGGSISSSQDTSVRNLRVIGGYKVNDNFAVELGYTNTSDFGLAFSGRSGGSVAYSGKGTSAISGFDIAAVLRPNVSSGFNNFFATVGVHSYKNKTNVTFTVSSTNYSDNTSESGTGAMFGAGYDWNIDKDVDVRLSLIRMSKLAGNSDSSTTNVGVNLIKRF